MSIASTASAQWASKWLTIGDMQHQYAEVGFASENLYAANPLWMYPAIYPNQNNSRGEGFWLSARNVVAEDGREFPVRISHIGPRDPGIGEAFRVEQLLVSRFPAPEVLVDGFETFLRPVIVDEVDENIPAERMAITTFNTSVGITVQQRAMAWSNEDHNDYHIIEYIFTNTGAMGEETEPDVVQTLEDVYFTFFSRNSPSGEMGAWYNAGGSVWGQFTMNDAVGDGFEDYGVDFRAQFSWMGDSGEQSYNAIGGPANRSDWWNPIQADSVGRLTTAYMMGTVTLHADRDVDDPTDDPAQPRVMTYLDSDDGSLTGANDHNDLGKMLYERRWVEEGTDGRLRSNPTHARIVVPSGQFQLQSRATGDPSRGQAGGWQHVEGYGPYTMANGESVRIVVAKGFGGLSQEAALHIGREYKRSGYNDNLRIPFEVNGVVHELTKNEWAVLATRDSLFKMFEKARQNKESGHNIPDPPRPPQRFEVTSGTDRIMLEWEPYAGHQPPGGWEIYRAQRRYDGIPLPDALSGYQLVAELDGSAREYEDRDVDRGQSYFYYIQALGDVNSDGTAMTRTGVPLRSSRHYTQTYEPAFLRRPPGDNIQAVRVVPNPYNIAADAGVRWDVQDRLGFLDVPGDATIQIYTQLGELVDTIEHTEGSGDVFWNLTTSSRQVVASGIYIAYIRDNVTGEHVFRKFVIIR